MKGISLWKKNILKQNTEIPTIPQIPRHPCIFREFIQVHQQIRDKQAHVQLQNDLVEHHWQIYGGDMN